VRELHLATCDELGVEPAVKAEIVALLDNLQQLLIGICIMQVRGVVAATVHYREYSFLHLAVFLHLAML
jgi:hypothetical protein